MISIRILALSLVGIATSVTGLFAQSTVVNDTFTYNSAASFKASWKYTGSGVSFTAGEPGLNLANSLAYRDFGSSQSIQPQQGWTISCGIRQTNYQRGQWFGLFTEDMCHGYLVRWDSSVATSNLPSRRCGTPCSSRNG